MNKKPTTQARAQSIAQITQSFHLIRSKMMGKAIRAMKDWQITPSQWAVISIVDTNPDSKTKDLAQKLGMTSSAVTQLVDGLVQAGYLARKTDPADRRSAHLRLAPGVEKRLVELHKKHAVHMEELFRALSDEELEQFAKLHVKIARK